MSWGHRSCASTKLLLNRAALLRQSGLLVAEYLRLNHKTGRPLVSSITLSMTHAGYHDSGLDNMSLVPNAITTAVVWLVIFDATVVAPALAVRPTRASMLTRVQIPVLRVRVARAPKASEPTVSESPTKRSVPCPLAAMSDGVRVAEARIGTAATASKSMVVQRVATK